MGQSATDTNHTRHHEIPPAKLQIRLKRILKATFVFILHQWLLIGQGVVCILAYYFPDVAKHGGVIRSEYSILYGAMALIFFISGLSIPRQKLFLHLLNWRLHVLVQVFSFLFIPTVMLAIVHIILAGDPHGRIDRALLAGYIFTACIPTTIASNVVMTRSASGDEAAALVEVLIANLLGPFITAAWTVTVLPDTPEFAPWRNGDGDLKDMYRNVFKQLGLSVLLPLVVGQLVRWTCPERTAQVLQKYHIPKIGTVARFLSAGFAGAQQIFKRISPEETIAVCFCGPAKSTALGIPLLYAMWTQVDLFTKAKTSVPVLLYTTEQICVAHFFVHVFLRWHRSVHEKSEVGGDDGQVNGVV
ncbi:hypothetical protein EYZ11_002678 [Aspergillus tanneri]|uniref:Uncharacterized protein n=1 Tax=Aspergillus tanneri TaxID=1220188 RepID=A0A4S3JQD3_9EURO|nr:hypothetical protein EYZ11_002678 [Aspergillus tanneri]